MKVSPPHSGHWGLKPPLHGMARNPEEKLPGFLFQRQAVWKHLSFSPEHISFIVSEKWSYYHENCICDEWIDALLFFTT